MNSLMQDVRYGLRSLWKSGGFTLIAVATLALGIGANTAVFSMVRALLIRPVDYRNLDRLVWVWTNSPRIGVEREQVSPADYLDLASRNHSFAGLAAWNARSASLTGGDVPEHLESTEVMPGLFSMLPARPMLGRDFRPEEGEDGKDGVVILSHGLWTRRFGADPGIVGRTLRLGGRERVVVGVMPRGFDFLRGMDLWTPLALTPELRARRDLRYLAVIGLLKPGVSRAAATAEVNGIAATLAREYPATNATRGGWVESLREAVVGDVAPSFYVLLSVGALLVLLIACANVANLLLARVSVRRREVAIRMAVGASRRRVVRLILTESVLLALAGAAAGVLIAVWGVDAMAHSMPASITAFIPGWQGFEVNGAVLAYAVVMALVTGLVFGFAPAFQISGANMNESLKEGQKTSGTGLSGMRARRALVVAEIAVALVMVTGAVLVVKGFRHQIEASPGFDPRGVLTMRVTLAPREGDSTSVPAYDRESLERLRAVPGVTSAALTSRLPWTDWGGNRATRPVDVAGATVARPEDRPKTEVRIASARFFETVRIPLLAGRDFAAGDDERTERVAIASRALARKIAPNGDAVGRLIRIEHPRYGRRWRRVIGVVGDATATWWSPVEPVCYVPSTQEPLANIQFAIRSERDPLVLAAATRGALARLNTEPAYEVSTLEAEMNELYSPLRMSASMMGIFGLLALVLATIGVYGVVAYSVSQRTHEIGVRMALGAPRHSVLGMVVRQGMSLAALGLGIGLPIAYAMCMLAASKMMGLMRVEAWLVLAITLTLAVVAFVACTVPARVAMRVEPMRALRSE